MQHIPQIGSDAGAEMGLAMAGVSEEQVSKAREIDLLSYLQSREPQELKPDGPGRYTTASHGSLVISSGK